MDAANAICISQRQEDPSVMFIDLLHCIGGGASSQISQIDWGTYHACSLRSSRVPHTNLVSQVLQIGTVYMQKYRSVDPDAAA